MALAVKLQQPLKLVGVQMEVDAIDPGAFQARLVKRDFDVAFNGTRAEPSIAGLRPAWSVAGANDPIGRNFGNYRNAAFDAHLDSAIAARDVPTARAHARQAYTAIVSDVPAVWMYEPRTAQFVHKRIRKAHVAPTAWWRGLSDWSIPENERIARDRIGLKVASRDR
jgi:peptide/nickel transport system substrate-binding protein